MFRRLKLNDHSTRQYVYKASLSLDCTKPHFSFDYINDISCHQMSHQKYYLMASDDFPGFNWIILIQKFCLYNHFGVRN